jgi:hypothetical protein
MWKTIFLTMAFGSVVALGTPDRAHAQARVWVGPNGGVAVRAGGYRPYYGGYVYAQPNYACCAAPPYAYGYPASGYAYRYPAYGYGYPRYYGYPRGRGVVVGPNGGAVYGPRGVVRWR